MKHRGAARRLAKALAVGLHRRMDAVGVHLMPKHYYSPIPDRRWLVDNQQLWTGRVDLTRIEWDLDAQVEWLREIARPFYGEVEGLQQYEAIAASGVGLGYGAIEAQVLHCFVRARRPNRIVEVGSGVSTACLVAATRRNRVEFGRRPEITCIEPFPSRALESLEGVSLLKSTAQAAPIEKFKTLDRGDLLFIDSSHAVKTGSDVLRLYLEVIPQLRPGVFVHIHDIFLPYLYQPDILSTIFYWQETALLLALLEGNQRLRVRCCLSALHYDKTAELRALLSDYRPLPMSSEGLSERSEAEGEGHFPASIWLETV